MNKLTPQAYSSHLKVGILGGGQLGKMLCQAASEWDLSISILDPAEDCPARFSCSYFQQGSFQDYETVMEFAQNVDILTIETEHVNIQALLDLQKQGLTIHPDPKKLRIIQDKGLQREFYHKHKLPTISSVLYNGKDEMMNGVKNGDITFPFVQKITKGGYDGRGVINIFSEDDLIKLMDQTSLVEELVQIKKEIAVVVARNHKGQTESYPPVEMVFHAQANMLDYLLSPADISDEISTLAINMAKDTINAFEIQGLLAVEFFIDMDDRLIINEVAPRPHNSGHHTIESSLTSQYQQHLRGILNLPLGSTFQMINAAMVNMVGEPGYNGTPLYQGFDEALSIDGVHLHVYGKTSTQPFRKMGHITIVDPDIQSLKEKAHKVRNIIKVIA